MILGCPAGAAFQHAALLVTQLVADHRPAPVRAPAPVQQPRDEAGLIIDANNAAYEAAEAADLAAQAAPSPGAARRATREIEKGLLYPRRRLHLPSSWTDQTKEALP